ncbi:MAG: 4Fe-4S cluster-binding domain-containing protein [Planctomycetota bacterium]|nr:4Fe-4S cluster-binding domain-containing protein [Planctomycetota bacterium]
MIYAKTIPTYDRFRALTRRNIDKSPFWAELNEETREAITVVSAVLPFRTNEYVVNELIDWSSLPDDPMYQLTIPQRDMLHDEEYETVASLLRENVSPEVLKKTVNRIRLGLNPHPAGQMDENVPRLDGVPLQGSQHKYRETMLFFPSQGQTCHAYCTFCFRWAQFVDLDDMKFASREIDQLIEYLRRHEEISDLLITGGDPMIMKTKVLEKYIEPILEANLEHLHTIRFGTKALSYWPQRFISDADSDDLMRLFERIVDSGKNLAIMGHYSHPVEFSTDVAQEAVRRIRSTGAIIRMQSPCIKHVNDDADAWVSLWKTGVKLGCVPYYMFVERDTGAKDYFALPLVRVWQIFRQAHQQLSGLGRTVRGPVMSAFPGKVHVLGVTHVGQEKAFVLEYLQARDYEIIRQPFFARYDKKARWFDDLRPLTERDKPFFPEDQWAGGTSQSDVSLSVLNGDFDNAIN